MFLIRQLLEMRFGEGKMALETPMLRHFALAETHPQQIVR
jgi:hypothetical protein